MGFVDLVEDIIRIVNEIVIVGIDIDTLIEFILSCVTIYSYLVTIYS